MEKKAKVIFPQFGYVMAGDNVHSEFREIFQQGLTRKWEDGSQIKSLILAAFLKLCLGHQQVSYPGSCVGLWLYCLARRASISHLPL